MQMGASSRQQEMDMKKQGNLPSADTPDAKLLDSNDKVTELSEERLDAVTGGAGAAKVRFSDFQITKKTDASSPL